LIALAVLLAGAAMFAGCSNNPATLIPAPSGDDLWNDPWVQGKILQAWNDSFWDMSNPNNPVKWPEPKEQGGWIYATPDGRIGVMRAPSGGATDINLQNPPTYPGWYLVGKFHTHPNPGDLIGPSPDDNRLGKQNGVPSIIITFDGQHFFADGPDRRIRGFELTRFAGDVAGLGLSLRGRLPRSNAARRRCSARSPSPRCIIA